MAVIIDNLPIREYKISLVLNRLLPFEKQVNSEEFETWRKSFDPLHVGFDKWKDTRWHFRFSETDKAEKVITMLSWFHGVIPRVYIDRTTHLITISYRGGTSID